MVLLIHITGAKVESLKFIYIPLWFYLYKEPGAVPRSLGHLHSTMVLLIPDHLRELAIGAMHLHSTMVLLIQIRSISCGTSSSFTFHYGSTYTLRRLRYSTLQYPFTFHYGSTYTKEYCLIKSIGLSFTFHYGSTYTMTDGKVSEAEKIYIPLWFYLYSASQSYLRLPGFHLHSTMVLLIPLDLLKSLLLEFYLHSTMVLLIHPAQVIPDLLFFHLHSTMVLLIPIDSILSAMQIGNLHSTMVLLIHRELENKYDALLFTFHYGSTYTAESQTDSLSPPPFTFHYGSTYTLPEPLIQNLSLYLHSTMVLLIPILAESNSAILPYLHSTMVLLILLIPLPP